MKGRIEMIVCYRCGKAVKGKIVNYVPNNFMVRIAADFAKSYHPACYAKALKEAELELAR
jgi:hypothetical protein